MFTNRPFTNRPFINILLIIPFLFILSCGGESIKLGDSILPEEPLPEEPEPEQPKPEEPDPEEPEPDIPPESETPQQEWLNKINEFRSENRTCGSTVYMSTNPVTFDQSLEIAAQKHSQDMADNNFLSHVGSNNSSFQQRAFEAGFQGSPIAENIAAGTNSIDRVISLWANSSGHCRNMMLSFVNTIGIAVAENPTSAYHFYWTLILGIK